MKKGQLLILGMLAVTLVFCLVLIACSDGSGEEVQPQVVAYFGEAGGKTYSLKITEKTARYAAQAGDTYELTEGTNISTGTVSGVTGGELTLKPANASAAFTATVSVSGISAMSGTITWTNNTTVPAPTTLTPQGSGVPKTIKITGYDSSKGITAYDMEIYSESTGVDGWPPALYALETINGQTITYPVVLWEDHWTKPKPWTGTGKFFIVIECNPPKDSAKDGAKYTYSENGTTPALFDIKDAVTTLQWSKFIWLKDYTAG